VFAILEKNDCNYLRTGLPFWEKLSSDEETLITSNTKTVLYRTGETVYSAANECVGVLLIKSGELRVYIISEEGKEITLYRLNQGEVCILSASCLLSNITFDVFIDAEKYTEVLLINSIIFAQLQNRNLYVENFALRVAVDRFSDVMWAMEQILFMSFDRRLAVFLLDETAKTGMDRLALTHEQIAKYMGSAREVVSRMLKYFAGEGIVEVYRGGVSIIDKQRLRRLI